MKLIRILENVICSVGLILTTVIIFVQVVNRYWLHFEIMWMNDLALYIFVSTVFITLSLTTRERGHTAVEMLQERILLGHPNGRKFYFFIRNLFSLCVVLIFLFPAYKFFLRAMKYPEYGTLIRWFNTSWIVYSFFVMVCLMILHLAVHVIKDFLDWRQALRSKNEGSRGETSP